MSPVLLTMMFGLIDGARMFMADQDAATAAREGARYALSGARYGDCTGIRTAATDLTTRSGITGADVTIQYDHGSGTAVFGSCPQSTFHDGDRVIVTATRTVTPFFPFNFGPLTVHATERRTILKRPGT